MDWQEKFERKYEILVCLLVESRRKLADKDPSLDAIAPPAEDYIAALDFELSTKGFEQRIVFLNEELAKALSSVPPQHPIRRELQQEYQRDVPEIIGIAAKRIQSGETFDQILGFLAHERQRVATEYCQYPIAKFGKARQDLVRLYRSAIVKGGRFGHYRDRALSLVAVGMKEFRMPAAFDVAIGSKWATLLDGLTIWGEVNEEKVPLTTLLLCSEHHDDAMMEWLFGDKTVIYPSATMIHTDVQQLPKLWVWCRKLFEEILVAEDFVKSVAKFHWFLSHAMFFERGSAAIGEWFVEALFHSKRLRVSWKTQPDLEALLQVDLQGFIDRYPDIANF